MHSKEEVLSSFGIPNEPLRAQCIACPASGDSDSWKYDLWHRVFCWCSNTKGQNDFFVNVQQVRVEIDQLTKDAGFPPILTSALPDTARHLVNCRHLLLLTEVIDVAHHQLPKIWTEFPSRTFCKLKTSETWVPRECLSWFHILTRGIFGDPEDWVLVRPVMELPFRQKLTTKQIGEQEILIVVSNLKEALGVLLKELRYQPEQRRYLVAPDTEDTRSGQHKFLTIENVNSFLTRWLSPTIATADHLDVFLFYLRHYCPYIRPFCVELSQSGSQLKALKIHLEDGTLCEEVSNCEKAVMVETHVLSTLMKKHEEHTVKIQHCLEKCKEQLSLGQRLSAKTWLRKKNLLEGENHKIEAQVLKIEECQALRNTTRTIHAVEDALSATAQATKQIQRSMKEIDMVAVSDDLREALEEAKEQNDILTENHYRNYEEEDNLEQEFQGLISETCASTIKQPGSQKVEFSNEELEALLAEIPTHEMPKTEEMLIN